MRAISKLVAGSMIAGAALLVSACGGETNTTNVIETNVIEGDNVVVDDMTMIDGANGDAGMMANDMMLGNDVNAM
jgi:hypothetical protein